jgi:hypothetical protein
MSTEKEVNPQDAGPGVCVEPLPVEMLALQPIGLGDVANSIVNRPADLA